MGGKRREEPDYRMSFDDAMDLADGMDLPDGAYWAMAHELAGLDYGDGFPMLFDSKNSRKRLSGPRHATTPKPRKQLEAFGSLKQLNEYHWQLRGVFGVLNWWPHKGKWAFNNDRASAGAFKDLLDEIKAAPPIARGPQKLIPGDVA